MLKKIQLCILLLGWARAAAAGPYLASMAVSSVLGGFPSVTWQATTQAAGTVNGYQINQGGHLVAQVGATVTAFVDTVSSYACGAGPYTFQVQAVDGFGNTLDSLSGAVNPPCPPAGLAFSVVSGGLQLTWTASAGAASYAIYKSTSWPVLPGAAPAVTLTTAAWVDAQPSPFYNLYLVDNQSNTSAAAANAGGLAVPLSPSAASASSPGDNSVALAWQASQTRGVTVYTVYRSTDGALADAQAVSLVAGTSYNDVSVTSGAVYQYWIAGMAGAAAGGFASAGPVVPYSRSGNPAFALDPVSFTGQVQVSITADASQGTFPVGGYEVLVNGQFRDFLALGSGPGLLALGCTDTVTLKAVDQAGNPGGSASLASPLPCAPVLVPAFCGINAGGMVLAWSGRLTPSAAISQYWIYRGNTPGFPLSAATLQTSTALTFTDGAAAGHYYRVYASTGAAGDPASLVSGPSAEMAALAAPAGLAAKAGNGSVQLNWQPVNLTFSPGVTGYAVYYGPAASTATARLQVAQPVSATTLSGLVNGVTYQFFLDSLGGSAEGPSGATLTAKPGVAQPSFSGFAKVTSPAVALSFSWPASTDLKANTWVAYSLYRADDAAGTNLTRVAALAASPTAAAPCLDAAPYSVTFTAEYFYAVRVSDSAGDDSGATVFTGITVPAAPAGLSATAGLSRITLDWSAVSDAPVGAYKIYVSTAPGDPYSSPSGLQTAGGTSFVQVVNNGGNYTYEVSAVTPQGVEGLTSTPSAPAIPFVLPPAPPMSGQVLPTTTTGQAKILLTLPYKQGTYQVIGYNLYRAAGSGAGFNLLATLPISATIAADTYLDAIPDTALDYVYQAFALDTQGNTSAAAALTFTSGSLAYVLGAPGSTPSGTSPAAVSGKVTLTWNPGASSYPVSAYSVFRATAPAPGLSPGNFLALTGTTSFQDSGLVATPTARTVYYDVRAVDANGNTGPALEFSVALPVLSGTVPAPSTPTGLAASIPPGTSHQVNLTWAPNPYREQVTAYNIYRDGAPQPLSVVADAGGAVEFYADTTVAYGAAVSYSVQAFASLTPVVSALSSPVLVSPYLPPPPTGLQAGSAVPDGAGNTELALGLSWAVPGSDLATVLERSTDNGASFAPLTTTSAAGYTDLVPAGSGTFIYNVFSFNGVSGPASANITFTAASQPAALTGTPLALTSSAGGVDLFWSSPAGNLTSFSIFRSPSPLSDPPALPAVASVAANFGTSYKFNDPAASASTAWYYAVAPVNGVARGPLAAVAAPVTPLPGVATALASAAGYAGAPFVGLSWNGPSGAQAATGYAVYRSTAADMSAAVLATFTAQTSYSDLSLTAGQVLYYSVASDNLVSGPSSLTVSALPCNPPAAPTGLAAVSVSAGALLLGWNSPGAAAGITSYRVYRSVAGSSFSLLTSVAAPGFLDAGLVNGLAYGYQVSGLNSAGEGPMSTSVSASPVYTNPPLGPQALAASSGLDGSPAKVMLTWQSPWYGSAGTFNLYRSTAPLGAAASGGPASAAFLTPLAGVSTTATMSYTDTVPSEGAWYYALTALGGGGQGEESTPAPVSVTAFHLPVPPALRGTQGVNRIDLAWDVPLDQGSAGLWPAPYRLYRWIGALPPSNVGQAFTAAALLTQTALTSFADTHPPAAGTLAYYFLSCVDAAGRETANASEPGIGGLTTGLPPAPPGRLTALPGDTLVKLLWSVYQAGGDLDNHGRYSVYRAKASDYVASGTFGAPIATDITIDKSPDASTTTLTAAYFDPGVVNKTDYFYCLGAVNDFGEAMESGYVPATPYAPLSTPTSGSLVTASLVTGTAFVQLNWAAAGQGSYNLVGYHVYRSLDGGFTYGPASVTLTTAAQVNYVDSNTAFGAFYTYRVTALDDHGHDGLSYQTVSILVPAPVNSLRLDHNAINPVRGDRLQISFSQVQPGPVTVKIYTLLGEYVNTVAQVDVPAASAASPYLSSNFYWDGRDSQGRGVASGVYIVHLEGRDNRSTARIAVIK